MRSFRLIFLTTTCLLLLLLGGLPAMAAGLAFVINSGAASIGVYDVTTHRELRRIPVLREPHHMALTPDHRYLLVGDTTGNQLLFLNPRTGVLEKRMPMSDPYQLVFSPDGKWLTIAGKNGDRNATNILADLKISREQISILDEELKAKPWEQIEAAWIRDLIK